MDQDQDRFDQEQLVGEPDEPDRVSVAHDLVEYAWGIIANAGGGDWTKETDEWQGAAAKWRGQYHEYLSKFIRYPEEAEIPDEA